MTPNTRVKLFRRAAGRQELDWRPARLPSYLRCSTSRRTNLFDDGSTVVLTAVENAYGAVMRDRRQCGLACGCAEVTLNVHGSKPFTRRTFE